jgi:hypothetical protein
MKPARHGGVLVGAQRRAMMWICAIGKEKAIEKLETLTGRFQNEFTLSARRPWDR